MPDEGTERSSPPRAPGRALGDSPGSGSPRKRPSLIQENGDQGRTDRGRLFDRQKMELKIEDLHLDLS